MNLIDSFLNLTEQIEISTICLLALGVLFSLAAFVKSAYFIYSMCSIAAFTAACAVRYFGGGDIAQIFIMLFFILMSVTVCSITVVRLTKLGWITRLPVNDNCKL